MPNKKKKKKQKRNFKNFFPYKKRFCWSKLCEIRVATHELIFQLKHLNFPPPQGTECNSWSSWIFKPFISFSREIFYLFRITRIIDSTWSVINPYVRQ